MRNFKLLSEGGEKREEREKSYAEHFTNQKTSQSLEGNHTDLPGNYLVFFVVLPSDMYSHFTMSRWFQWMITILQIKPLQNSMLDLKGNLYRWWKLKFQKT